MRLIHVIHYKIILNSKIVTVIENTNNESCKRNKITRTKTTKLCCQANKKKENKFLLFNLTKLDQTKLFMQQSLDR